MSDRTMDGLHEADTLLIGLLLAREARRSGDPDGFLDELGRMLNPLLFTAQGFDAVAYRLDVARLLLDADRTIPPSLGGRRERPAAT